MSSVIVPNHYALPASKEGTCRRQSLTTESCFPTLCTIFSGGSSSDSCEKDIPDLKVLAENSVNTYKIEKVNDIKLTFSQPVKRSSDNVTDGPKSTGSVLFSVTSLGIRNIKDETDTGEKLQKKKPTSIYRAMQKDMRIESNRLETFQNVWPLNFIDPADLAAVGFFYLQCDDKVQCAFCRGIIVDWKAGDDPLTEHTLHFPLCPFLLNRDVGNVPISGKSPFLDRYNNSHAENTEFIRRTKANLDGEGASALQPKFLKMESRERRRQSFGSWKSSTVKPHDLAEAGFFYTGTSDIVACFYCGGTLGHWVPGDDPVVEHKKHFPHCEYLKSGSSKVVKSSNNALKETVPMALAASHTGDVTYLMRSELCTEASRIFAEKVVREALEMQLNKKGRMFQSLEELCSTILEIQDEAQKQKTNTGVESQAQSKSASGDRHMCKICWDKEMGIVFLPCGHVVACPECAQSVLVCPLCRTTIEDMVRAYIS